MTTSTSTTPATPPASPHAQEAETKTVAKAAADAAVATDPHATHAVNLSIRSPKVLASTGTGATIGFFMGGPPGALIGGAVGLVAERYQIAGGPVGKVVDRIKGLFKKKA